MQSYDANLEKARGRREKILIAEDNDGLREAAEELLKSLGYRVVVARDGETAVRLFEQIHETIDLVLLDVVMPGLNGPEAYARMAATRPGLPVLFTTGYATEQTVQSVRSVDYGLILQKPYGTAQLAYKLRQALDGKRE
jgi:CheY-like chemotaxis protein